MGYDTKRTTFIAALALFAGMARVTTAKAFVPRLIMFYGSPLQKPVILADWQENLHFVEATGDEAKVTFRELEGRPYIKVALFWGPDWVRYMDEGKPVDKLRPEQAGQHGRFYPALDNAGPVIEYEVPKPNEPGVFTRALVKRQVSQEGITILAKHGIPVRVGAAPGVPKS